MGMGMPMGMGYGGARVDVDGDGIPDVRVGPFETRAEAEWWIGLIRKNTTLAEFIEQHDIMPEAKE